MQGSCMARLIGLAEGTSLGGKGLSVTAWLHGSSSSLLLQAACLSHVDAKYRTHQLSMLPDCACKALSQNDVTYAGPKVPAAVFVTS
jgi:hypothetical protein